jgi:hypothetical protein
MWSINYPNHPFEGGKLITHLISFEFTSHIKECIYTRKGLTFESTMQDNVLTKFLQFIRGNEMNLRLLIGGESLYWIPYRSRGTQKLTE